MGLFKSISVALVALALFSAIEANPNKRYRHMREHSSREKQVAQIKQNAKNGGRALEDYYLPRDLMPLSQFVRLQPYVNGDLTIDGYTEIVVDCVSPTSSVILLQSDISIDQASVLVYESGNSANTIATTAFSYDPSTHFWTAMLAQELEAGKSYVIGMNFVSNLQSGIDGFFLGHYTDVDGTTEHYYGATQFEPNGARKAFPCFDEPNFKYKFTTELIREDAYMSASNMPIVSSAQTPDQPGWTTDTFAESEIMPVYLNSYLVSDFGSQSIVDANNVKYGANARSELVSKTTYGLEATSASLNYLINYFSVPYPMPKLDTNALPYFFSGAMENWGLMNYIDYCFMHGVDVSPAGQKQVVCEIVAHEVAHDWFGNLLTVASWEHIWIGEGYTEFYTYKACDSHEPTMKVEEQFVAGVLQSGLRTDDALSSHPLIFDLADPSEANSVFDGVTYNKGSSVARMMEYIVTEPTMQAAMTNYLTDYAFGNAYQDDLFAAVDAQVLIDGTLDPSLTVKQIFDTWSLQTGYPLINVTRNGDGTATVTQSRFLMNSGLSDPNDPSWYVPITFTTQSAPDFDQYSIEWMLPSERSKVYSGMPPAGEWVIFNIQHLGFFRVNYDSQTWADIINGLDTDYSAIHVYNRIQIISDAFNLARAALLPYDVAFATTNFLQFETEYSVIETGADELYSFDRMFRTQVDYPTMQNFLLTVILPTYNSVGFQDSMTDPHTDQLKRDLSVSMACYLNHQACLDDASALFAQYMSTSDATLVTPNLRDPVYCHGVGQGGQTEFDFLYNEFLGTIMPVEKDNYLYGMACSEDVAVLNNYLDLAFSASSGISQNDITYIFSSMKASTVGESTAWDYIRTNADAIATYTGSFADVELYTLIISENFNTDARLQELQQFQTDNAASIVTNLIDQAIANTQVNIDWMNANYDDIVAYLVNNGYGP